MPRHANTIEREALPPPGANLSTFRPQHFADLYLSLNPNAPTFASFKQAYNFGKTLAPQFGFHLRIKTTNLNTKDGVLYKYVCCQRQGLSIEKSPSSTDEPVSPNGSPIVSGLADEDRPKRRLSKATSRCDCRWSCRIIGMKMSDSPDGFRGMSDRDTDMIWYWDRSDKEIAHNHPMEPIPDFGQMRPRASTMPTNMSHQRPASHNSQSDLSTISRQSSMSQLHQAAATHQQQQQNIQQVMTPSQVVAMQHKYQQQQAARGHVYTPQSSALSYQHHQQQQQGPNYAAGRQMFAYSAAPAHPSSMAHQMPSAPTAATNAANALHQLASAAARPTGAQQQNHPRLPSTDTLASSTHSSNSQLNKIMLPPPPQALKQLPGSFAPLAHSSSTNSLVSIPSIVLNDVRLPPLHSSIAAQDKKE